MVAINENLIPASEARRRSATCPHGARSGRRSITVLNSDWSMPAAGTQPLVDNLYQGMTLDAVTGLYDERARDYSPSLGRWMEQDPAQYINGANTYQFVDSSPVGNVDGTGLYKLPGVKAPVLVRIGKKHTMSGGRYYINYYYMQNLADIFNDGESPSKLAAFRLAHDILTGLKSLTGVGGALVEIAKAINDNGAGRRAFRSQAFPEFAKAYLRELVKESGGG
ncbi:MAG: RHS repeat-associated core domain-containing protein [Phycisphaerae bacterium]